MTPLKHNPLVPSPPRGGGRRARLGFTLIEVVLAIGLSAMVVYLLSTATELYLANVDASRGRVENAQLARTLLDQIAADLAATRAYGPMAASASGGGPGQPQQFGGGSPVGLAPGGGSPSGGGAPLGGSGPPPNGGTNSTAPGGTGGAGGTTPLAAGNVQGLFGTVEQLRIDRAPYANWERASREVEPAETSAMADMPISVRYFFVGGNKDRITAERLAGRGVVRESTMAGSAGLYRETIPTAAIAPTDPPLPTGETARAGAHVELLAPEVVAFELAYYNGTALVDEWDPVLDRGLPRGVEIRLTIAEPRFQARPDQEEQRRLDDGRYRESELVEYRRYVRLPLVGQSPPAQALLPLPQQGGGPQQPGGGQQGGPQGGQGGAGGQQSGAGGGGGSGGSRP